MAGLALAAVANPGENMMKRKVRQALRDASKRFSPTHIYHYLERPSSLCVSYSSFRSFFFIYLFIPSARPETITTMIQYSEGYSYSPPSHPYARGIGIY